MLMRYIYNITAVQGSFAEYRLRAAYLISMIYNIHNTLRMLISGHGDLWPICKISVY